MKTTLKITLATVLILLMSTGAALALSMDYTIDLKAKNRDYKHFNQKKLRSFDFDVDLNNAAINSVTLSIKHWKNWNTKKKEIWGLYIGDKFYKFNKSQKKWKTMTFDVTDAFTLGDPFSVTLVNKKGKKSNIYLDWVSLNINYDDLGGNLPGDGPIGVGDTTPNSPAPVPEPGTLVLLGAGLLVVARFGFKKMNGKATSK